MTGQLRSQMSEAAAGRLVIELGQVGTPAELERRLRTALRDPSLSVLHWSDSAGSYLDGAGRPAALPAYREGRAVTLLERQGRPMTALVHDPAVLDNPNLVKTVTAAARMAVEHDTRLRGQVEAQASEARTLPTGYVTFLVTDIEGSTGLLQRPGPCASPRAGTSTSPLSRWPAAWPAFFMRSGMGLCTSPATLRILIRSPRFTRVGPRDRTVMVR
jgi:hypothetical protein